MKTDLFQTFWMGWGRTKKLLTELIGLCYKVSTG